MSAVQYTDDSLASIQELLTSAIESLNAKYAGIIQTLENSLDVANRNRQSLREVIDPAPQAQPAAAQMQPSPDQPPVRAARYEERAYTEPVREEAVVQNTYEPELPKETNYEEITLEEALEKDEEGFFNDMPGISDYGSVDEIKDFDLAFDDFK